MNTLTIFFAGWINHSLNDDMLGRHWKRTSLKADNDGFELIAFKVPKATSKEDINALECFFQERHPKIVKKVVDQKNQNIKD